MSFVQTVSDAGAIVVRARTIVYYVQLIKSHHVAAVVIITVAYIYPYLMSYYVLRSHPTMCGMGFNAHHSFVNISSPRTKNLEGNQRRKLLDEG